MISENPTTHLGELARVCSQLVKAKAHYCDMAVYFNNLFSKHANCDPESVLPNSPLAELYQRLGEYYMGQIFAVEQRIMQLDGIANATMLPGLDY